MAVEISLVTLLEVAICFVCGVAHRGVASEDTRTQVVGCFVEYLVCQECYSSHEVTGCSGCRVRNRKERVFCFRGALDLLFVQLREGLHIFTPILLEVPDRIQ